MKNKLISQVTYKDYVITEKLNRKKTGIIFGYIDREGKHFSFNSLDQAKGKIDEREKRELFFKLANEFITKWGGIVGFTYGKKGMQSLWI